MGGPDAQKGVLVVLAACVASGSVRTHAYDLNLPAEFYHTIIRWLDSEEGEGDTRSRLLPELKLVAHAPEPGCDYALFNLAAHARDSGM